MKAAYRYRIAEGVSIEEVEDTLFLALISTQSLHGEEQTRLDASYDFDREDRSCLIDASTAVGRSLNKLFTGFMRREYGSDAFTVERVVADRALATADASANGGAA